MEIIMTILRHLLTLGGGYLATKFAITCEDIATTTCSDDKIGEAIAGVILVAIAAIWAIVQKILAKKKLEKAIAAPAGKAE